MSTLRLVAFLTCASSVLGLASSAAASQWGVQGGASFRSFSASSSITTPSETTEVLAGLFYERDLVGPLSLQPELFYRGAFDEGNWLVLPVLAKVKFSLAPSVHPYLFAGPEIAFGSNRGFDEKVDFAVEGGAGLELALGSVHLLAGGRYVLGTVNIGKAGSIQSRHVYATVGVGFPL